MEIDTLESVRGGNATQWIRVRGADAANPVLLLIQQGPGLPMINETRRFEHVLGLEQAFTVVYWDQRGCGRSLRRPQDRAGISRERLVGDTVSLLEELHDRFGTKTYVAGFSFGATIGAYAAVTCACPPGNETVASVESALRRAVADLNAVKARWVLVGGLAVSARTIPRFTKDLDFAVAVASDGEAKDVVHRLRSRDYDPVEVLEQDYVERLSGVRLARKGSDVLVDLLFASSGIENEVVASADRLEVLPRLTAPVATTAHLIALKVLAGHNQDLTDLGYLIPAASPTDLDACRRLGATHSGRE